MGSRCTAAGVWQAGVRLDLAETGRAFERAYGGDVLLIELDADVERTLDVDTAMGQHVAVMNDTVY